MSQIQKPDSRRITAYKDLWFHRLCLCSKSAAQTKSIIFKSGAATRQAANVALIWIKCGHPVLSRGQLMPPLSQGMHILVCVAPTSKITHFRSGRFLVFVISNCLNPKRSESLGEGGNQRVPLGH